jgi:anhydro-N-acetylmuramic acid kinase
MLVMGMMSGTSADGIDVALAEVHGAPPKLRTRLVRHGSRRMPEVLRKEVLRIAEGAACTAGEISQLNFRLGMAFAEAAVSACREFRVALSQVELIGSHGQTIFHQGRAVPFLGRATRSTLQIGEPAVIAAETGITTVGDFRVADMAVGGQGAPLVPYVDWLLLQDEKVGRVALNLGGIGNVTVLPAWRSSQFSVYGSRFRRGEERERSLQGLKPNSRQGLRLDLKVRHSKEDPRAQTGVSMPQVMAFDTGPGNMVIDGLVGHFTGGRERYDRDARMAMRGRCVTSLLEELLRDPYLRVRPPKSTGREYYGLEFVGKLLKRARRERVRPEDLVRTATVFTALSVVDALNRFVLPRVEIGQVIVSGGGARNPLIMAQLAAALAPLKVMTSSEVGVPEEAKEAYAFALLAYETWNRRAGNLPSATGAGRSVVLGKICFG